MEQGGSTAPIEPSNRTMDTSIPHRPRRAALRALISALVCGLILTAAGPADASGDPSRWAMKRETNESRIENNRRRVDLRAHMSELAQRHSRRMARRGELFHTANPAGYYLDGVSWSTWGENVGYTSGTVSRMQRLFMQSPGHRANVLNRDFRHVAIGTVRRDGVLWVTVFFYG
jgi:uncharacterized protein YkwD